MLCIRPLLPKERLQNATRCIKVVPNTSQIVIGKDRSFTYDYVMDERAQQTKVYNTCVSDLVEGTFDGYNATILAYGQTVCCVTMSVRRSCVWACGRAGVH